MKSKAKLVAGTLAAAMVGSAVSGCSSSDKSKVELEKTVSADSVWYECQTTEAASDRDTGSYMNYYSMSLGRTEEGIVMLSQGVRNIPSDFDYSQIMDYIDIFLDYYTFDGTLVTSLNPLENMDLGGITIDSYTLEGDQVVFTLSGGEIDDNGEFINAANYEINVDYVNGTVSDLIEIDSTDDPLMSNPELSYEGTSYIGDVSIERFWMSLGGGSGFGGFGGGSNSYTLRVTKAGEQTILDLSQIFPDINIYDMTQFLPVNDTTIICVAEGDGAILQLDTTTMTMTDVTADYEWLMEYEISGAVSIPGVGSYCMDGLDGINEIDFENQTMTQLIDYNNSNINRANVGNMTVVNATEDTITIAGEVYRDILGSSETSFMFCTLTRCDSNPNAGKSILRAASLTGYDYAIYESIAQFNNSNDQYFMIIDDRYDLDGSDYNSELDVYQAAANLGDQLSVDIMAGVGPDVLFNCNLLPQLSNGTYLADLTSVATGDDLFMNVIDACKVDGVLYQVPLAISLEGLTVQSDLLGDGTTGMTYAETNEFINVACNGDNPITGTKSDVFDTLFWSQIDLFREGSTMNFDCDAFRNLAEYISNDYIEPVNTGFDDMYDYMGGYEAQPASYGISNIAAHIYTNMGAAGDYVFVGLPSEDGRGPQFTVDTSVAVSAQTENLEGCLEFVDVLLTPEIQRVSASDSLSTPINRQVLIETAQGSVDYINSQLEAIRNMASDDELIMMGYNVNNVDYSIIDYYVSVVEGCTVCADRDIAISTIISEEMQAYFSGQKTLDSVIDTMSNRIATYQNERG